MANKFSEEEVNEFKERFELFDMVGEGNIPAKDIGLIVRSLDKSPTEAELKDVMKKVGAGDTVTFPDFLEIMACDMNMTDPEQVVSSLKVFDKEGNGKISVSELKHILTKMGETLTEREVNEVMQDVTPDSNGMIKYEKFIAELIERYVV
eukprot:Nitzschia sp. Nitz4//scaffold127_size64804//60783//61575//NITZ4_006189-RA/size64804-processed-gene-0.24-mRNA-1//1//CDS//3329534789//9309//frame0